jgi:hypothetical protein
VMVRNAAFSGFALSSPDLQVAVGVAGVACSNSLVPTWTGVFVADIFAAVPRIGRDHRARHCIRLRCFRSVFLRDGCVYRRGGWGRRFCDLRSSVVGRPVRACCPWLRYTSR